MNIYKGQTLYIEHHNSCIAYQKEKPNVPIAMDGPSFIECGTVESVTDNGVGVLKLEKIIDVNGEEKPFVPQVGHTGTIQLNSNNTYLEHFVFESKEKCQEVCDQRNQVQMNNWTAMETYDTAMQKQIDMAMKKELMITEEDLKNLDVEECIICQN